MNRSILIITFFASLCSLFFQEPVNEEPVITLERTACYGTCSEYKLLIYNDGTVIFQGKRFVLFEFDTEKTRIPYDSIRVLLDEAKRIGYAQFKDIYTYDISDLPTTYTSVILNGKIKEVTDYYNAPNSLIAFEHHIDRAVHSARWVGVGKDHHIHNKLKPTRDSTVRARQAYYRSLTDAQVDSLWMANNRK